MIDGQNFDNDLVLLGKAIVPNWWRDQGHKLKEDDLTKVKEFHPKILIIGTGYSGNMKLQNGLKQKLDFPIKEYLTKKAVEIYNQKIKIEDKIAAAFHITC